MTRWIDLYEGGTGTYLSDIYDMSSDFDTYLEDLTFDYTHNDGTVILEVRFSYDGGVNWNEWIKINEVPYVPFFIDRELNFDNAKFQYRVTMQNESGGVSPVFKFFRFAMVGTTLINNNGDLTCKPELWIKKINGDGDIKLINESTNQTLELQGLFDGEEVYLDCENEDIITDRPLTYRYDSHNGVFIELGVGENLLSGEGEFELDIRYEFKTLQG